MTDFDKLKEAITRLNDLAKDMPKQQNIYVDQTGWYRLLNEFGGFKIGESNMSYATYYGVQIICDSDVPHGEFIMCTAEQWQAFKDVKNHPWVDKDLPIEKLFQLAEMLAASRIEMAKVEPVKYEFDESITNDRLNRFARMLLLNNTQI